MAAPRAGIAARPYPRNWTKILAPVQNRAQFFILLGLFWPLEAVNEQCGLNEDGASTCTAGGSSQAHFGHEAFNGFLDLQTNSFAHLPVFPSPRFARQAASGDTPLVMRYEEMRDGFETSPVEGKEVSVGTTEKHRNGSNPRAQGRKFSDVFAGGKPFLAKRSIEETGGPGEGKQLACHGRIVLADDFAGNWKARWPLKYAAEKQSGAAQQVNFDGKTGLRISYPKGGVGAGYTFAAKLPPRNAYYMEYDVRFGARFDFVLGGKLPGLCGGECNTGGQLPTGYDGWSTRYMWRKKGAGVIYAYHPDQPTRFGRTLGWA